MQASNSPDKITLPFAESGAKQTIPVDSQIGIEDGRASYTDGFPPVTRTPIAAGGVPPFGTDFNGLFYAITNLLRWQNAGGTFAYDGALSAAIGGYPAGAILRRVDGGGLWLSTADDNTADPDAGGAGWLELSPNQFSNYNADLTYATGDIVRGSDGQFYEFYDRDQTGEVQGVDPTNPANRPHIWMEWDGVRPGSTIEWRSETLPEGYVENDGAEISRADYRRVFSAVGTTHGVGDGSTTFLLPDDRGEFKRGWDNGRGVDPGRALSAHQFDQMQRITGFAGLLYIRELSDDPTGVFSGSLRSAGVSAGGSSGNVTVNSVFDSALSENARVSGTTSGETRSRNNAVIWLTKI